MDTKNEKLSDTSIHQKNLSDVKYEIMKLENPSSITVVMVTIGALLIIWICVMWKKSLLISGMWVDKNNILREFTNIGIKSFYINGKKVNLDGKAFASDDAKITGHFNTDFTEVSIINKETGINETWNKLR